MDGGNNLYILGKSVDCGKVIDEAEKTIKRVVNTALGWGTFGSLVIACPNVIIGLLDGKKLSQIESSPVWQPLLGLAVLALVAYFVNKCLKKTRPVITKYRQYCSVESLVLDSEKIYGSTATGSIQLRYEKIIRVSITPTTYDMNNGTIGNDILQISDIAGNVFSFYSFGNCRELKNIIDMQINKGR